MSWETCDLGRVASFLSGGTPSKDRPEYWGGDIPWVSAKDLKGTRIVPANTVLFVVRSMSLANEFRVSLAKVPVAFNQDLKALRPRKDVNPAFLFYALFAQRDQIRQLAGEASHGTKKLPAEVAQGNDVSAGWAPYQNGHWAWIDPWGWTWIDDAPWGFAVSHYGRWAHIGGSWGWVPGLPRSRAYYAPALVVFIGGDNFQLTLSSGNVGGVGWFPLAPREIYRPTYPVSRGYFENLNAATP